MDDEIKLVKNGIFDSETETIDIWIRNFTKDFSTVFSVKSAVTDSMGRTINNW